MRVWLDDLRDKPGEFDVHVRTAHKAIELLRTGEVVEISLDHDLGDEVNGTGYDVASWIEEQAFHGNLPKLKWHIHSQNNVGAERMLAALQNADRFWSDNLPEANGNG